MNTPLGAVLSFSRRDNVAGQTSDMTRATRVAVRQAGRPSRLTPFRFLGWFAVTVLGSFGLIWLYAATMPMAYLDHEYPFWLAKRALLAECRRGDVAVFGDSRAVAAVMPAAISVPVTNFAFMGASPLETYFAVKRALSCATPPKMIVIAHSTFKYFSDDRYWPFAVRTGFLNYDEMRQVEADADRLHDDEIDRGRPADQLPKALRDRLFQMRFPAFYFDSLLGAFGAARLPVNRAVEHDILKSRGHSLSVVVPHSEELSAEAFVSKLSLSPLLDLYFSRTLELAAQKGIPVYIVAMPINEKTCERMPTRPRKAFEAYMAAKAAAYPSVHVVEPTVLCWPNDFFGDGWHVNAAGASTFSKRLSDWLQGPYFGRPSTNIALGNHQDSVRDTR